jgi:hypothetical protein
MSDIYRSAITVIRKQPYIDWANDEGREDDVSFPSGDRRTVYLVPESGSGVAAAELLDEFWQDIFEDELAAWSENEAVWPAPRTRELFDAWFDLELTEAVVDLVPEEPLSAADVESADIAYTISHCAWCDLDLDPSEGRRISFTVSDRAPLAAREGLTLVLPMGGDHFVTGILSAPESDGAKAGDDLIFMVCSSRCEKLIRKGVPRALRRLKTGILYRERQWRE